MPGTVGMDVDAVRQIGLQLKGMSDVLEAVSATTDNLVEQLSYAWQGPDLDQFRSWWDQQHRLSLRRASSGIRGLGESATLNADDQGAASGGQQGQGAPTAGWSPMIAGLAGSLVLTSNVKNLRRSMSLSASREATVGRSWGANVETSSQVGGVPVGFRGDADLYATAKASVSGQISAKGVDAAVVAGVAVGASARAAGRVGNEQYGANARGEVRAEASAQAFGKVHAGKDGVSAVAGASAQATVSADAQGEVHAGGASVGAGAHAYAGIGGHATAQATITKDEVRFGASVGGSIGFGGGVDVNIKVRPAEVIENLQKFGLFR